MLFPLPSEALCYSFVSDRSGLVLDLLLFLAITDRVMLQLFPFSCQAASPVSYDGHLFRLFHMRLLFPD